MRTVFVFLFCSLCLNGSAMAAAADHKGALRVSTLLLPPLATLDQDTGIIGGTMITKARKLAKQCSLELEVVLAPNWIRAYTMAKVGLTDAVLPTTRNDERKSHFDFPSEPLLMMSFSLIVRKDSPHKSYTGLEMLDGKRIGKHAGTMYEGRFDKYIRSDKVTLAEHGNMRFIIDELLTGRLDFAVDTPEMMLFQTRGTRVPDNIRVLEPAVGSDEQFLALSKHRANHLTGGTTASNCLLGTPS